MSVNPILFFRGILKSFSVMVLFGILGVLFACLVFIVSLLKGLPNVSTLKNYQHPHATEVFSDDGHKIGEFSTERRYPVQFAVIPKHVLLAFLAAEDAKFYEHRGIDFSGVMRAILSNLMKGRYAQGGSTITQQVARALLLVTKKKEITRKIREMILAWRMEGELTKNEILALYLSEIYLGHGAYGIGAAAKNYFGKSVEQLSLPEGALLAGLPQRPNDWDPFHSPLMAKRRQLYVLKRMVEERFITEKDRELAMAQPLKLYRVEDINTKIAPYFTEYVRAYLMKKYGSESILSQGYKVYTTVRVDFQSAAERALGSGLRGVDKRLGWRGVTIHLDSQEKILGFLNSTHEEILEKINATRILPATPDAGAKKLAYDLSPFEQSPNFAGPTPLTEGEYYKAVILEVQGDKALARVGQTSVTLPLSSMGWVTVADQPLKKVSQILKVGDVVDVKGTKISKSLNTALVSLEQEPEIQGALLSYELEQGFVRAMVGGTDFVRSPFNRALHAKRQVGSTFKPILYAAAIDKGFSPSSIVTDSPIVFKYEGGLDADTQGEDWKPRNYGNKFEGDIPLRLALIRSMNIPTVKILNEIGVDYGIGYARSLGITAPLPRELTIALGSWSSSLEELMRAYAIFPRLGRPLGLTYIKKVVDGSGIVLEEFTPPKENTTSPISSVPAITNEVPSAGGPPSDATGNPVTPLAITPQTAYVMTDMLKGVIREGTGRAASGVSATIAGKTGTSNDHRDAWFVGYSPYIMAGVWIGYDKDKPLDPGETGGRAAAPIWAEYMQSAVKAYPKGDFPIPPDVVFAYIDRETGKLATSRRANRVRVAFKMGSVPNLAGDNISRIGEPGTRATTTEENPIKEAPPHEDTSDFLRQGYED